LVFGLAASSCEFFFATVPFLNQKTEEGTHTQRAVRNFDALSVRLHHRKQHLLDSQVVVEKVLVIEVMCIERKNLPV